LPLGYMIHDNDNALTPNRNDVDWRYPSMQTYSDLNEFMIDRLVPDGALFKVALEPYLYLQTAYKVYPVPYWCAHGKFLLWLATDTANSLGMKSATPFRRAFSVQNRAVFRVSLQDSVRIPLKVTRTCGRKNSSKHLNIFLYRFEYFMLWSALPSRILIPMV
jgi:hypothetical protein